MLRPNLTRTMPTMGVLPEDWDVNASSTWSDDSDVPEDAVLEGVLQIAHTMFHVRAMRVVNPDLSNLQEVLDPAFAEELEAVFAICADGPLETTKIDGHEGEYVVVIYPFAT